MARQRDCRACPIKESCLTPKQLRRMVGLSPHFEAIQRARERNATSIYQDQIRARSHLVEGVFAHLDRLGFRRVRMRGIHKVDCEGFIASLAHNLKKAVRQLAVDPPAAQVMGT